MELSTLRDRGTTVPAVSFSPIGAVVGDLLGVDGGSPEATRALTDGDRVRLVEVLAAAPDPRAKRGVRYPLRVILAVAVCATLAGARSFAAVADWAADLTPGHREQLGLDTAVPDAVTLWRPMAGPDPD